MSTSASPPGSLGRLRSGNRRAILSLLGTAGPLSRADLSRGTGLSRTTVSSLVNELVASGHLVETAQRGVPHKGGSGRPPLLVRLATPPGGVVGVDIGHAHIRVAAADGSGAVLADRETSVDADAHGAVTLDRAARMVRDVVAEAGLVLDEVAGIGMCVPAPLDRRSARVTSRILRGWGDLVPAAELERRMGLRVVADNDANLGALAELHHGAAHGRSEVVYVKLASGVGAGIVLGGRLHRGATGIAGEIGHVQVDEAGPVCRCGNRGCLETQVAATRLIDLLQPAYDEELTTERLAALDAEGDAGVRRVLNDAGRVVGRALADLCNSLNPELIVVGGELGAAGSLVVGLRAAVDRYAQPDTAAAVTVEPGRLGKHAQVLGAVELAVGRFVTAD